MAHGPRAKLEQAISSIQNGDLRTGKRLLAGVLRQDPGNVQAWLWLATAVDDLEKRAECLRRVLTIRPDNKIAWQRLAALTSIDPKADRPKITGYEGLEFQCPNCGGEQHFHVGRQGLICTHCGHFEPIEQPEAEIPASEQENLLFAVLGDRASHADIGGKLIVTCRRCGSTTAWSARHGTVECPFCGTDAVLHASTKQTIIMPQGLIPFQIDEKQARDRIRAWWRKGWLRPSGLPERVSTLRLRGVYVPFWTFDHVYRVQWFEADDGSAAYGAPGQREHLVMYDDVLVCASYTISGELALGLEPFDTDDLVVYQPEYLAGWPAEVSQLSMADASIHARERMVKQIRDEFPVGAKVSEVSTQYMTCKHVLLPVWIGMYRYRGQSYRVAVNGQTGRVTGAAPRSLALVFDLATVAAILVSFASLAFVLLGPRSSWRLPVVFGAAALCLSAFVVYFLTMLMGWRDTDIGREVQDVPLQFKNRSLSPANRKAIADMIDELTEERRTSVSSSPDVQE